MSTPTSPAPFDPHAFPSDLVAAQQKAARLYAELHALQAQLPWSRERHPGWPESTERAREHPGRPESPGWPAEDAAAFDRLMEELRQATAAVQCHPWWAQCRAQGLEGPALVAARQALKTAEGAAPLRQDDVATTA